MFVIVYIRTVGYAVIMSRFILSLICLFISVSVAAETVYKKVNPDGSVEFTDLPSTDSEEVKVRKPTTYSPSSLPSINLPAKKAKPIDYEITIIEPANNATIIGASKINATVSISPNLTGSHKIRYELGSHSIDSQKTSVSLNDVVRGTHVLSVSVINSKGEIVGAGASVTFHMKRFFKKTVKPKVKTP